VPRKCSVSKRGNASGPGDSRPQTRNRGGLRIFLNSQDQLIGPHRPLHPRTASRGTFDIGLHTSDIPWFPSIEPERRKNLFTTVSTK
jgi:hypothetical protein